MKRADGGATPEREGADRRVLVSLLEIASATAGAEDLETVLETLMRSLGRLFPVDAASLALVDQDGLAVRELLRRGGTAVREPEYVSDDGTHLMSWVIRGGRPLWRNDLTHEVRFRETTALPGMKSDMVIPLRARGRVMGAFRVACRRRHAFDLEDFELLNACADLTAVAVETQRLLQMTRRQAETDGVTGVFNHRHFATVLREAIERARAAGRPLALLMTDIDHFKRFNDTYGHQAGDDVLRHVAQTLVRALRRGDVVARYGGEEFAAVLHDTDAAAAGVLAERVRKEVESSRPAVAGLSPGIPITISVGAAVFPEQAASPMELVAVADRALYRSKRLGRNRVSLAGDEPGATEEGDRQAGAPPVAGVTR